MLVGKGSLSFRTFRVSGKKATPSKDTILEKLDTFSFAGIDTVEEGSCHGWLAPDHLFDGDFNVAKIFRGRYALFGFRVDTRKVPGPLLQAHTAIAFHAALEAEGLDKLSARQKREIKQDVKQQLLAETPPAQRAYGVFWNVKTKRVFLQNTSKGVVEAFRDLFERSFDLSLEPLVPGLQAAQYARDKDLLEPLKDARPLELRSAPQVQQRELVSV
jgi:recombination associated protein RdgC